MIQLSPSILAADFADLGRECRKVLDAGADMLHIDVMDGHFVPNISLGVPVLASLHKALPDAYYDVHLMISEPVRYAGAFVQAGASCITFHAEAVEDAAAAVHKHSGHVFVAARLCAGVGDFNRPVGITLGLGCCAACGSRKTAASVQQSQLPLVLCIFGNRLQSIGAYGAGGFAAYGGRCEEDRVPM